MTRKGHILWVMGDLSPLYKERLLLLQGNGWDADYALSLMELEKKLTQKRFNIILIADNRNPKDLENLISKVVDFPELKGARMILTLENFYRNIMDCAAAENFRDMIPMDLNEKKWLYRILFSSSGKIIPYPLAKGLVGADSSAKIELPARLVWLSKKRMRIECQSRVPKGRRIVLYGELARRLGAHYIAFQVEEIKRSYLHYRFSFALIGSWIVHWPIHKDARHKMNSQKVLAELMENLRLFDFGVRHRVFIASSSRVLRKLLIGRLDSSRFEVLSAIHTKALVNEPKFFSPDIVFIDAKLCKDGQAKMFQDLCNNLPPHAIVVVCGEADYNSFKMLFPFRNILVVEDVPAELASILDNKFLPVKSKTLDGGDGESVRLFKADPLSHLLLSLPAQINHIHQDTIQLRLPFPLKSFAMGYLNFPKLKKNATSPLWLKVFAAREVELGEGKRKRYEIDCFFATIAESGRSNFSLALKKLVNNNDEGAFKGDPRVDEPKISSLESFKSFEEISRPQDKQKQSLLQILSHQTVRHILVFIFITTAIIVSVTLFAPYLSLYWQKSGSEYSERLEIFKQRIDQKKRSEYERSQSK